MTQKRQPSIGGWYPGRLQLSTFIRDFLANGEESWANEIYSAYKAAAEAIPKRRSKEPRKVISYHNFLTYTHMLRKLGLIEYLTTDGTNIDTEPSSKPYLAPKHFIRAVPGRLQDPDWQNPHKALYG